MGVTAAWPHSWRDDERADVLVSLLHGLFRTLWTRATWMPFSHDTTQEAPMTFEEYWKQHEREVIGYFTLHAIAEVVWNAGMAEGVAQERVRCAAIASAEAQNCNEEERGRSGPVSEAYHAACRQIAEAIRTASG